MAAPIEKLLSPPMKRGLRVLLTSHAALRSPVFYGHDFIM